MIIKSLKKNEYMGNFKEIVRVKPFKICFNSVTSKFYNFFCMN